MRKVDVPIDEIFYCYHIVLFVNDFIKVLNYYLELLVISCCMSNVISICVFQVVTKISTLSVSTRTSYILCLAKIR